MNQIVEFFKNLGTGRLIALIAILGILGGFFSFVTDRMNHAPMALLGADIYPAEVGKIIGKIENMGIPYELRGDGSSIYVPQDQVLKLRMQLAGEGLATGSIVGNEIFDRSDTLGMTSFLQDVHQLRALEGEMARTITTLKPIASARVHLVIPKKSLFAQDAQDPSASIILKMRHGGRLNESQIQAIQHLVSSAVPGLNAEAISMIDDQGTLLARGSRDTEGGARLNHLEELHVRYEERLSRSIESLLEKTLGPGKVKAKVSVDMDYDHITENAELFDPDGQVVRSSQTAEDGTQSTENTQQAVTVQNTLPNAPAAASNAPRSANNSKKSDETLNYEISKTTRNRIREVGGIKRLSVAVLVDGYYTKPGDAQTYTPRPVEEMEQIKQLVRSSIGFQEPRGDQVEVINMKFVVPDVVQQLPQEDLILGLTKPELMRLVEVALLAFAAVLVSLLVLKPLIQSLFQAITPLASLDRSMTGENASQGSGAHHESNINVGDIEDRLRNSGLSKIEEVIKQHPQETVAKLRGWLKGEV